MTGIPPSRTPDSPESVPTARPVTPSRSPGTRPRGRAGQVHGPVGRVGAPGSGTPSAPGPRRPTEAVPRPRGRAHGSDPGRAGAAVRSGALGAPGEARTACPVPWSGSGPGVRSARAPWNGWAGRLPRPTGPLVGPEGRAAGRVRRCAAAAGTHEGPPSSAGPRRRPGHRRAPRVWSAPREVRGGRAPSQVAWRRPAGRDRRVGREPGGGSAPGLAGRVFGRWGACPGGGRGRWGAATCGGAPSQVAWRRPAGRDRRVGREPGGGSAPGLAGRASGRRGACPGAGGCGRGRRREAGVGDVWPGPATGGRGLAGGGYAPGFFAALAAFAAAFCSCLCARTLASDSGPVMSATERKDFSSP